MIRKAYIIGTLALGIAIAAGAGIPDVDRLASSARSFQQNFRNLKTADSLNSVERFIFSLFLTNSESPRGEKKSDSGRRS